MIVHIYSTEEQAAQGITELLMKIIKESEDPLVHIAVSGGTTPKLLFNLWAEMYHDHIDWKRISLFWVDERCVPSYALESNYGMTKKHLLDKVPIPAEQIHPITGEGNPDQEAKRYSELVKKMIPHSDGWPCFDLVILGMGANGHTGSIFSGQSTLLHSKEIYEASVDPQGMKRITMTAYPMYEAKKVIFHATGSAKAEIIKLMKEHDKTVEKELPAVYICNRCMTSELYTDKEGGKLIGHK